MAVNWESGDCQAYKDAIAVAKDADGEFDHTVKEWRDFADLREALIWAMLVIGYPPKSGWGISDKNWEAVYARLYIYERIRGTACRVFGDRGSVYFQPEEVYSMIGLSVNAGNKSDAEFKKRMFQIGTEEAEFNLKYYRRELAESEENEATG